MTGKLARLAELGFQIIPIASFPHHFVLERGGFVVLVERSGEGFGGVGAPGLLTERGMAVLVWRGERAFFVAKGFEQEAAPAQVEALRRFGADLRAALQ